MTEKEIDRIRPKLEPLAERFSLRLVLLFGSQAEGGAAETSDIDIGVLVDDASGINADYDLSLQAALFDLFGTDRIDVVYLNRASPLLCHRAVMHGIVLYERDGAHADFTSYVVRYYSDTRKFRMAQRQYIQRFISHGS